MRTRIYVENALREAALALSESKVALDPELKIRLSRIILHLMCRRGSFGLFVILGWRDKWNKYTDLPDRNQDIYAKHHINVMEIGREDAERYDLELTLDFDGAILIDADGMVLHSGIMIEGLRPKKIADKVNPGKFRDLSEQFGFEAQVHLRHLSAISASHVFKGTTVFTVSEETGAFHIFEGGKIMYHHSQA